MIDNDEVRKLRRAIEELSDEVKRLREQQIVNPFTPYNPPVIPIYPYYPSWAPLPIFTCGSATGFPGAREATNDLAYTSTSPNTHG